MLMFGAMNKKLQFPYIEVIYERTNYTKFYLKQFQEGRNSDIGQFLFDESVSSPNYVFLIFGEIDFHVWVPALHQVDGNDKQTDPAGINWAQ